MQNLTVQKLCIGLVVLAFFVLAPWMTSELLEGNTLPLIALLTVGGLLVFLFVLKDRCWMVIPFTLPIEGRFNFLPLNFSMQETAVAAVFAYIFIQIVMGRQIRWKLGPALVWMPLSGLLAVFLYHWISSGDIGIRALGGTGWGGRKYFTIAMAALSMPILFSFSGSSYRDFQKIPFLYFAGVFTDLIPDTFTTFFPATAPYIFRFYSAVNVAEYGKELMGNFGGQEGITRYHAFGRLGSAWGLMVLSYFPVQKWLNPSKLWVVPSLLFGFFLTALSGFRSFIFNFAVIFGSGLFTTARMKAFVLLPLALAGVLIIAGTQGTVINYPNGIQRALSFLPGNWNTQAKQEGKGSNEWRQRIRELFFAEYFKRHPLLGDGYGFDPNLARKQQELFLRIAALAERDEYADVRGFIEMKQPHEGDIGALLVVGIVGTVFFVAFCFSLILVALKSVLTSRPQEVQPIQIWAFALLVQNSLSFFIVFGDLSSVLFQLCSIGAILIASERLRPKNSLAKELASSFADEFPHPSVPHPAINRL
jgi:hypothetical protein